MMNGLTHNGFEINIPKPIFLVVEDVGWWEGQDGSSMQQPFRTAMPRRHCPADYDALVYLAEQLSMRIILGMVLCEWDLNDFLQNVLGSTWMETSWDNSINRGPWLEEAADCLRQNQAKLEIALHGVGHEFWQNQLMHRTEFHDNDCWMRSPEIIKSHLEAFGELLNQHGLGPFPRCFIPPALKHSFGNGPESFQAIVQEYGVHLITTRFAKARKFSPPITDKITWEENVLLLERGHSPTPWHDVAAQPEAPLLGPLISLHWSNLLHQDPSRNHEVIVPWINAIRQSADNASTILASDIHVCSKQYCHHQLAQLIPQGSGVLVDRKRLPPVIYGADSFFLRIQNVGKYAWRALSGNIVNVKKEKSGTLLLELETFGNEDISLQPCNDRNNSP